MSSLILCFVSYIDTLIDFMLCFWSSQPGLLVLSIDHEVIRSTKVCRCINNYTKQLLSNDGLITKIHNI